MKKKLWITLALGIVLTLVGCSMGGKLNLKLSEDEYYIDKNGLDPVVASSYTGTKKFEKIKELQIDTNIINIELISNTSENYNVEIENLKSDYVSPIEVEEKNSVISISNKILKQKPIGILDEESSKLKLVIEGPIQNIDKIFINDKVGSISIKNATLKNVGIKGNAIDVDLTDSTINKLNLDLELSDLSMSSTNISDSKLNLNKSRIFGEKNEFKGDNILNFSIVEGELGLKNYDEIFNQNTPNKIKLEGKLNRFEFINER